MSATPLDQFPAPLDRAVDAALGKQAEGIVLLDLAPLGAFTDYFLICSGSSARQVQAICDAVEEKLAAGGLPLRHVEGYDSAEWVLLDYGDFVIHIFHQRARLYYDIERLWRAARRHEIAEPQAGAAEKEQSRL